MVRNNIPQKHFDGSEAVRRSIDAARRLLGRITVSDGHKELCDAAAAHAAIAQAEATLLLLEQQQVANEHSRVHAWLRLAASWEKINPWLKREEHAESSDSEDGDNQLTLGPWVNKLNPGIRDLFKRVFLGEAKLADCRPVSPDSVPSPWDVTPK